MPRPAGMRSRLSKRTDKRHGVRVALTILGTAYLAALVGAVVALVTAATAILYLFAYTPLKQRTALCTLVGAVSGALPPRAARSSGHDLGRRAHPRTSRGRPNGRESRTRWWTMIWSPRIRQWLGQWVGAAIVIALAGGLFWMAMEAR